MGQCLVRSRLRSCTAVLLALFVVGITAGCGSDGNGATRTLTVAPTSAVTATPAPSAATVAEAPISSIRTTDGTVAYRSVGAGPPIVLIMGFGGSQNNWTPSFVAALARRHRVVTFDNAGVGATSGLPAPLTVTAMAKQSAALLTALHIGPVDVLGWSMGGTIAQALAVTHPALVSRLVLAATYPGNGTATPPTPGTVRRLTASVTDPAVALPLLFPASAQVSERRYLSEILSWQHLDSATPVAVAAQGPALTSWQSGTETAGQQNTSIAVPTLIADGAADLLTPATNASALATIISGAQQDIYPDAGHAFLFQVQDQFLARVTAFLG